MPQCNRVWPVPSSPADNDIQALGSSIQRSGTLGIRIANAVPRPSFHEIDAFLNLNS